MKKTKVLLIAFNNLGKGGIQSQLMGIVRSLKDRVDFDIVVWDKVKDFYTPELEQYGVRIIPCFRQLPGSRLLQKADAFLRYSQLKGIISRVIATYGPYDAIHCHNAYDAAPCLAAAKAAGIPVRISHAHNTENPALRKKRTYPAYRALYAHRRKQIRRRATHMLGCSRQVTDYFFGPGLGQVVHIGIDLSRFTEICGESGPIPELLHVGSMSQQKNQLFLVRIMEQLVARNRKVHLTMIGSGGAYFDRVRQQIAEKGLESYISLLPPETPVPPAMASADLFVFPSTFEGFGIVLIEAQATGLRCLTSDVVSPEANCGGIRQLPLSLGAAGWAEVITEMLADGSDKQTYDVSDFSVDAMTEQIFAIYKSV